MLYNTYQMCYIEDGVWHCQCMFLQPTLVCTATQVSLAASQVSHGDCDVVDIPWTEASCHWVLETALQGVACCLVQGWAARAGTRPLTSSPWTPPPAGASTGFLPPLPLLPQLPVDHTTTFPLMKAM